MGETVRTAIVSTHNRPYLLDVSTVEGNGSFKGKYER